MKGDDKMTIRERIEKGLPVNPFKLGGWVIYCLGTEEGTWARHYDEKNKMYAEYILIKDEKPRCILHTERERNEQ